MSSTDRLMTQIEGKEGDNYIPFCKWVSLACDSDRFDIDCGRVRCRYVTPDFMATTDGDTLIVVPATFRFASQMIAHGVVANRGGSRRYVDIAIRRLSVRCARPYRFAYIDCRHYDVMGVSGTFTFVHRNDGHCDCDYLAATASGTADDIDSVLASLPDCLATTASSSGHTQTTAAARLNSFISSLMDTQSNATQCSVCRVPSNYRQVLEYLKENIDRLSVVDSNIDRECNKKTESLNNSTIMLQYQIIKTKILNREMENCRRFVDGLVSSLLETGKAIFRTSDVMVFVKIDETHKNEYSASERFMNSIINSQKQIIANLTTTYKEVSIMINTMQLFGKVL